MDGTFDYAVTLAKAGITLDLIVNGWEGQPKVDKQLGYVRQLLDAIPGCIDAIEGANEVNNNPQSWGGRTDPRGGGGMARRAAAQAAQSYLYAAVKSDPILKTVPVIDYTDERPIRGDADFSNIHCYDNSGKNSGVDWWIGVDGLNHLRQVAGARPFYVTEMGNRFDRMSKEQHANYTCSAVATLIQRGAAGGYIYALFDDASGRYGLCSSDGTPRLAATYLKRLLSILKDTDEVRPPKRLDVAFSDMSPTNHGTQSVVVARADGSLVLLFWMWHPPASTLLLNWKISQVRTITEYHLDDDEATSHGRGDHCGAYSYASGVKVMIISAT